VLVVPSVVEGRDRVLVCNGGEDATAEPGQPPKPGYVDTQPIPTTRKVRDDR